MQVTQGKQVLGEGSDKAQPTDPTVFPRPDADNWGPTLEPGLQVGHASKRLGAGLSPMEPGRAQPEEETWVPLPMGSPPVGGAKGVG
ncbi:hypothetical protein CRENBAI_021593 [Crenichthys baileyi]|uniref:Uncharacterized protein n=1 Tax=Crenichthys baileyi TaxID=28760 RepID=A0AAV9SH46_9TELE